MLTGAAFGIVFLYLLDSGAQAFAAQRGPGGPIGGPIDDGLGRSRTSVGQIRITPLGEVEVSQANVGPKGNGNAAEALPAGARMTTSTSDHIHRDGRVYTQLCVADNGPGLPDDVMAEGSATLSADFEHLRWFDLPTVCLEPAATSPE